MRLELRGLGDVSGGEIALLMMITCSGEGPAGHWRILTVYGVSTSSGSVENGGQMP